MINNRYLPNNKKTKHHDEKSDSPKRKHHSDSDKEHRDESSTRYKRSHENDSTETNRLDYAHSNKSLRKADEQSASYEEKLHYSDKGKPKHRYENSRIDDESPDKHKDKKRFDGNDRSHLLDFTLTRLGLLTGAKPIEWNQDLAKYYFKESERFANKNKNFIPSCLNTADFFLKLLSRNSNREDINWNECQRILPHLLLSSLNLEENKKEDLKEVSQRGYHIRSILATIGELIKNKKLTSDFFSNHFLFDFLKQFAMLDNSKMRSCHFAEILLLLGNFRLGKADLNGESITYLKNMLLTQLEKEPDDEDTLNVLKRFMLSLYILSKNHYQLVIDSELNSSDIKKVVQRIIILIPKTSSQTIIECINITLETLDYLTDYALSQKLTTELDESILTPLLNPDLRLGINDRHLKGKLANRQLLVFSKAAIVKSIIPINLFHATHVKQLIEDILNADEDNFSLTADALKLISSKTASIHLLKEITSSHIQELVKRAIYSDKFSKKLNISYYASILSAISFLGNQSSTRMSLKDLPPIYIQKLIHNTLAIGQKMFAKHEYLSLAKYYSSTIFDISRLSISNKSLLSEVSPLDILNLLNGFLSLLKIPNCVNKIDMGSIFDGLDTLLRSRSSHLIKDVDASHIAQLLDGLKTLYSSQKREYESALAILTALRNFELKKKSLLEQVTKPQLQYVVSMFMRALKQQEQKSTAQSTVFLIHCWSQYDDSLFSQLFTLDDIIQLINEFLKELDKPDKIKFYKIAIAISAIAKIIRSHDGEEKFSLYLKNLNDDSLNHLVQLYLNSLFNHCKHEKLPLKLEMNHYLQDLQGVLLLAKKELVSFSPEINKKIQFILNSLLAVRLTISQFDKLLDIIAALFDLKSDEKWNIDLTAISWHIANLPDEQYQCISSKLLPLGIVTPAPSSASSKEQALEQAPEPIITHNKEQEKNIFPLQEKMPSFPPQPTAKRSYDINNKKDIEDLEKAFGNTFTYDIESNKNTLEDVFELKPTDALNGGLGVFLKRTIQNKPTIKKHGLLLAPYPGERISLANHYDPCLLPTRAATKLKKNKLYVRKEGNILHYAVLDANNKRIDGKISEAELKHTFKNPLSLDEVELHLSDILKVTHKNGHTPLVEDEKSQYNFSVQDADGKPIEVIDAQKIRGVAAWFNHSRTPNCVSDQKKENGKYNIYYYMAPWVKEIKAGEPLTIDYKEGFRFKLFGIEPVFLHKTDNWQTPQEKYFLHKHEYLPIPYGFSDQIINHLSLKSNRWIMPTLFAMINENKASDIEKLPAGYPVEIPAYALNETGIATQAWQEHLTALMFAAYLGQTQCIPPLLAKGADANRCTFISGQTALTLLLVGPANNEAVTTIGSLLIDNMPLPFVKDKKELSCLHYAIVRNVPELVEKILDRAEKDNIDILADAFNRKKDLPTHADLDYCITQGYFTLLRAILEKAAKSTVLLEGQLNTYVEQGLIFKKETFLTAPREHIEQFKKLLLEMGHHELLKRSKADIYLKKSSAEKPKIIAPAVELTPTLLPPVQTKPSPEKLKSTQKPSKVDEHPKKNDTENPKIVAPAIKLTLLPPPVQTRTKPSQEKLTSIYDALVAQFKVYQESRKRHGHTALSWPANIITLHDQDSDDKKTDALLANIKTLEACLQEEYKSHPHAWGIPKASAKKEAVPQNLKLRA